MRIDCCFGVSVGSQTNYAAYDDRFGGRIALAAMALIALSVGLSGCVTTTPLTRPSEVKSLIAYTKQLRSDTSAGLDGSVAAAFRDSRLALESMRKKDGSTYPKKMDASAHDEIDRPDYAAIATWWCPRHQEVANAQEVSNKYGAVCTQRGGRWRPPYCENGEGLPMFLAAVSTAPKWCTGGYPTAVVRVIEPKGALDAYDYIAALGLEVGYKTREAIASDEKRERMKSMQQETARAIAVAQLRADAQRGTKICSVDGGVTTEAFVLDKTQANRFEVRIHDVWSYRSSMSTSRPTGGGRFGSIGQVVFVDPEGWRICG